MDQRYLTSDAKRCRYMVFNDQIESGLMVRDGKVIRPVDTACGYVKLLSLGTLVSGKKPEKILIIGCGGGVGPQMFIDDYGKAVKRIDVVDIDRKVFEMAGKYFGYPYPDNKDSVIRSHVIDGRNFIRKSPDTWDYIVLDAYTAGGRIPKHLVSKEFFELAKRKTDPGGVVVCNIISSVDGPKDRLFKAVYKTVNSVFRHVYVFPRDLGGVHNIIVVASDHEGNALAKMELGGRFIKGTGSLIKQPVMYAVTNSLAAKPDVSSAPLLTDDFCPTDSMVH